jgi:hypothetical protein
MDAKYRMVKTHTEQLFVKVGKNYVRDTFAIPPVRIAFTVAFTVPCFIRGPLIEERDCGKPVSLCALR